MPSVSVFPPAALAVVWRGCLGPGICQADVPGGAELTGKGQLERKTIPKQMINAILLKPLWFTGSYSRWAETWQGQWELPQGWRGVSGCFLGRVTCLLM